MNPLDRRKLGMADTNLVKVSSRRGQITMKVKITHRVPEGTVFATFHFAEAAVNLLTNDALDAVAKIPEYKVSAVQIEPVQK